MSLLDYFRRTPPAKTDKPLGRSGTTNLRGFLQDDDPNVLWQWPQSLDLIEEMRRTDSTIKWMLALLTTPLRAAEKSVEPSETASDDSDAYNEAAEIAAYCEHALFDQLDGGFDDWLRQALLFLPFGHYAFEVVADFRPCEFSYIDKDGNEQTVEREMYVIDRLAPRMPRTILKWVPDDGDRSKLDHVQQWLADGLDPTTVDIPADRLVVLTHDKEGDDWRGNSILRPAYLPYRFKVQLENLEAIALERSAGLPIAYPATDADDKQLDAMQEALSKVRQGENLYLVMPGPKQSPQNPEGWLVEELSIQGDANRSPDAAINRHDTAIARNVMAEFMKLGHEQTGARATADVQQDPYYQALQAHANYIAAEIRSQLIARLVAWNYPQAKRLPTFVFSKIQAKNLYVLGQFLSAVMGSKGITPDFDLENYLRDLLGAPAKELDDGEDPDALYKPTPPVLPPGASDGTEPQKPGAGAPPEPGKPGAAPGQSRGDPATMADWQPQRTLHPAEEHVRFAEISDTLDRLQAQVERAGKSAMAEPIAMAEAQSAQIVAMADPVQAQGIEVDPTAATDAIRAVLQRAYDKGHAEVLRELSAQLRSHGIRMADLPNGNGRRKKNGHGERESALEALALSAAQGISDQIARVLKAAALREIETGDRPTGPGFDAQMTLKAATRGAALNVTSAAFSDGRFDALAANEDIVDHTIYTALLDSNTCEACSEADGEEETFNASGEVDGTQAPNPDCLGGGACRCMLIPVVDTSGLG